MPVSSRMTLSKASFIIVELIVIPELLLVITHVTDRIPCSSVKFEFSR